MAGEGEGAGAFVVGERMDAHQEHAARRGAIGDPGRDGQPADDPLHLTVDVGLPEPRVDPGRALPPQRSRQGRIAGEPNDSLCRLRGYFRAQVMAARQEPQVLDRDLRGHDRHPASQRLEDLGAAATADPQGNDEDAGALQDGRHVVDEASHLDPRIVPGH